MCIFSFPSFLAIMRRKIIFLKITKIVSEYAERICTMRTWRRRKDTQNWGYLSKYCSNMNFFKFLSSYTRFIGLSQKTISGYCPFKPPPPSSVSFLCSGCIWSKSPRIKRMLPRCHFRSRGGRGGGVQIWIYGGPSTDGYMQRFSFTAYIIPPVQILYNQMKIMLFKLCCLV